LDFQKTLALLPAVPDGGDKNLIGVALGQQVASKGGYFARFAEASGTHLLADGAWIVP
jgi:hypothetical protein